MYVSVNTTSAPSAVGTCEASWFDSISNRTSDSIRIDRPIRKFKIFELSTLSIVIRKETIVVG